MGVESRLKRLVVLDKLKAYKFGALLHVLTSDCILISLR